MSSFLLWPQKILNVVDKMLPSYEFDYKYNKESGDIDMITILIKCRNISAYLRAGEFYRNLDTSDLGGIVEIPPECFHENGLKAADLEEFRQLLRVMTFWMLDEIPAGILDFCADHDITVWEKDILDLPGAIAAEIMPLLLRNASFEEEEDIPLHEIIETDRWDLIMYSVRCLAKNSPATLAAAEHGNLRLLRYLREQGFHWHEETCMWASKNGHLECLQYAHENGCPWDASVYICAARNGHLECMEYAFSQNLGWDEQKLGWDVEVCTHAALRGQLLCLQFAHENGCRWDSTVHNEAASNGHLSCMQYAHEQGLAWHVDACKSAAANGHLHCLQYAHENGCPWDNSVTARSAEEGHIYCLQYALEQGCPVDEQAPNMACQGGHLECLQLLHARGVAWNAFTSVYAALCPNVALLQYLHENGCPWDEHTPSIAAREGNINPLRYALEHNCATHDAIVQFAVQSNNNLECARYLVEEQMLRMDGELFQVALLRGDLACLQYLLDQGCPFLEREFFDSTDELEYCEREIFHSDNPEFVQCVELAVVRGWTPDEIFISFAVARDESCKAWLIKEGYYVPVDELQSDLAGEKSVPQQNSKKYGCAVM